MVGNTSVCSVKHDRDNREWPCLKDLQAESDRKKMFSVGEQYVNHLDLRRMKG